MWVGGVGIGEGGIGELVEHLGDGFGDGHLVLEVLVGVCYAEVVAVLPIFLLLHNSLNPLTLLLIHMVPFSQRRAKMRKTLHRRARVAKRRLHLFLHGIHFSFLLFQVVAYVQVDAAGVGFVSFLV